MRRIVRLLAALAGCLTLTMLTLSWQPAAAVPMPSLSPASGPVGTIVTVSGTGMTPNWAIEVRWLTQGGTRLSPVNTIVGSQGNKIGRFSTLITIPSTSVGTKTLWICERQNFPASDCAAPEFVQWYPRTFSVTPTPTTTKPPAPTTAPPVTTRPITVPPIVTAPLVTTPGATTSTTTTVPAPVIVDPALFAPTWLTGIEVAGGFYGRAGIFTVDDILNPRQPTVPPRCTPTPGSRVVDFDDLSLGESARPALESLGATVDTTSASTNDDPGFLTTIAPVPGTITSPHAVQLTSIRFGSGDSPQTTFTFAEPQQVFGIHVGGDNTTGAGISLLAFATNDIGPPPLVTDGVTIASGPTSTTHCLAVVAPPGTSFTKVMLNTRAYGMSMDQVFASTTPYIPPAAGTVVDATLTVVSPYLPSVMTYSAGQDVPLTGAVIVRSPAGAAIDTRAPTRVTVTLPSWDRTGVQTVEATLADSRGVGYFGGASGGRLYNFSGRVTFPQGPFRMRVVATGPDFVVTRDIDLEGLGELVTPENVRDASVDFYGSALEVTQGARGRVPLQFPGTAMAERPTYVADRTTIVRGYGTFQYTSGTPSTRPIIPTTARLIGTRGGRTLPGSPLAPMSPTAQLKDNENTVLLDQRKTQGSSWNFELPSSWTAVGGIELRLEINPNYTPGYLPETEARVANWIGRSSVDFIAVPEVNVYIVLTQLSTRGGDGVGPVVRSSADLPELANMLNYTNAVFPMADNGMQLGWIQPWPIAWFDCLYVAGYRPVEGEAREHSWCLREPITSPSPWDNALIADFAAAEIAAGRSSFVSITFDPDGPIGCGGRAGYDFPLFHNGACGPTFAQEAAHSLGLVHVSTAHGEAAGGGGYDRFAGDHGEMRENDIGWDTRTNIVVPPTTTGRVRVTDFDGRERWVDGEVHRHDFMSYGTGDLWVSSETWIRMAAALRNTRAGANLRSTSPGEILAQADTPPPASLVITGEIIGDSVSIAPPNTVARPATVPTSPSTITVRLLDDSGELIDEVPASVSVGQHDNTVTTFTAMFDPAAPAVVEIRDEGAVIATFGATNTSAPEVSDVVVAPDDDNVDVSWTASDADGDDLISWVEVSTSATGPFTPIGGTSEPSFVIEPGQVPFAGSGFLRVVTSDGVRSTTSDAVAFEAQAAPPTLVSLDSDAWLTPGGMHRYRVQAVGLAEDASIEWLVDDQSVSWGETATIAGSTTGTHSVRIVARDATGAELATTSFDLVVDNDVDVDALPDAWEDANQLSSADASDAQSDADQDSLIATSEYALGSNPNSIDTDGDGYSDATERDGGTDPADVEAIPVALHGVPGAVPALLADSELDSDSNSWLVSAAVGGVVVLVVLISLIAAVEVTKSRRKRS